MDKAVPTGGPKTGMVTIGGRRCVTARSISGIYSSQLFHSEGDASAEADRIDTKAWTQLAEHFAEADGDHFQVLIFRDDDLEWAAVVDPDTNEIVDPAIDGVADVDVDDGPAKDRFPRLLPFDRSNAECIRLIQTLVDALEQARLRDAGTPGFG